MLYVITTGFYLLQCNMSTTSLSTLIKSACDKSSAIRSDMCNFMVKTDFKDVTASDVKSNSKVSKLFLAKCIIDLTKIISEINNSLNPVFKCESLKDTLDNICDPNTQLQADIKLQLATSSAISDVVDKALKQHSVDIEKKLSELHSVVSKLTVTNSPPVPPTSQPACTQDTSHVPKIVAPEPDMYYYKEDFISVEEEQNLIKFLSTADFKQENGHSVKNFGASYQYTGAADSKDSKISIPDEFSPILDQIKALYPEVNINQCLVNFYDRHDSFLPQHSDKELAIDPESSIYTVSLGQDRTVIFKERHSDTTNSVVVKGRSMYAMTRSSQDFYTHQIDNEPDTTDTRYSLTFRTVGSEFRKSTVVIGDSNSKYLLFGQGKGTFGKGLPGKRVQAPRVDDIDPYACAGYANVVLLAGTNNLWPKNVSNRADICKVFETLRDKIDVIRQFRKDIKIVLLPVLPTRLGGMNRQIHCYNTMVFEHFISSGMYFNVSMPSTYEFCDHEYLLRKEFLRNSANDAVHLNSYGLSRLAQLIKSQIFGRYSRRTDALPYRRSTGGRDGRSYSGVTSCDGKSVGSMSRPSAPT